MALQLNYNNDNTGQEIVDAYYRVENISINKDLTRASFFVYIYVSDAARAEGKIAINSDSPLRKEVSDSLFDKYFTSTALDAIDTNPISQAYLYLKNEDEDFSTATDI